MPESFLDFGLDIEESVHVPRVGGLSMASYANPSGPPTYYCEVDCGTPDMQAAVADRGVNLDIVGPWHFHSGSYEGIHVRNDGTAQACGDPRRAGQPEAL
jgi:gamma-glutamyltranspeptidase